MNLGMAAATSHATGLAPLFAVMLSMYASGEGRLASGWVYRTLS